VSKFLRRDARVSFALNKRNRHRPTDRIEGEARETGVKEWAERNGVTTGRFEFQASPIEFAYKWNDDLPWLITVGGEVVCLTKLSRVLT
jgi:hypothetical protein